MTAAQFELLDETEAVRILRWRFAELLRAGFEPDDALVLAAQMHVDLHQASELLRNGCPQGTALRILL